MFDTMKRPDITIPPSLMLLICIIQKLTDCPQQLDNQCSTHQDIFYASSCAALFLRLICPAIIAPLEWGALRQPPQPQRPNPSSPSHIQSLDESMNTKYGYREAARSSMLGKNFSNSEMQITTKKNRNTFVPSLLRREEPANTSDEPTEEELKSINAMDQNPAVAAIILVAHLLCSTQVDLLEESKRNQLNHLISTVIRVVPLQKLEVYMQRYEEKARSIVDPSTQKAFESPHTRKALLAFARSVQKVANLSILNRQFVEV